MNEIDTFYLRNYAAFALLTRDGRLMQLGYGAARLHRGDKIVPLPFVGTFKGMGRGARPQRGV